MFNFFLVFIADIIFFYGYLEGLLQSLCCIVLVKCALLMFLNAGIMSELSGNIKIIDSRHSNR